MAQTALWLSASSGSRSEYGMAIDNSAHGLEPPRAQQASPTNRWDASDSGALPSSASNHDSPRRMSMEYPSGPNRAMYGQAELDQAFSSLQGTNSSSMHHSLGAGMQSTNFDRTDGIDGQERPSYSMYSAPPPSTSFNSHRYRTNASSSSSLNHGYGMGTDSIYSHSSYSDSVPSFVSSTGAAV